MFTSPTFPTSSLLSPLTSRLTSRTWFRASLLGLSLGGTSLLSGAAQAQAQPTDATPVAAPAAPAAESELEALKARLDEVDQRSRIAERKLKLAEEDIAKRLKESAVVTADNGSFQIKNADGTYGLAIKGLLMVDSRFLLDDKALELRDTFVSSRVRPSFDANLGKYAELHFLPDFGNGAVTILDAYGELKPFPWLRLRAGKSKSPVGIERLQGDAAVVFVERALPTQLSPNRDVGFSLVGDIAGGIVSYTLGVTNGAIDGQNLDTDTNFAKDFVGRLAFQPFKSDPYSFLNRLSFGVGGTTGNHRATAAVLQTTNGTTTVRTASVPGLPSYRSTGAQTFFTYLVNDAAADGTALGQGRASRISPYITYYNGSFGLIGELIWSRQHVVKGAEAKDLNHRAFQVVANYVIGGTAAYEGTKAQSPFDVSQGKVGAVELAARFHELKLDNDTFPTFANPNASVKLARALGGQVAWYWSRNVKLAAAFESTWFKGGAASGADRLTEKLIETRVQVLY